MDRNAVGAIAKPLVHASTDATAIADALNLGVGVALPGEAWRNQLPLTHSKRRGVFQRLPFAQRSQLDVRARWDQPFIIRYAAAHLQAQLDGGATIVTTPGHVHGAEAGNGRENDLRLARAATEDFRARRAHHPRQEGWPARHMYASIVVHAALLPDAVENLVRQYSEVEADGYWIVVVGNQETGRAMGAITELAFRLESWTDKPAVVSCGGRAQSALLAHGLAAICSGHQHGSFTWPPEDWSKSGRGGGAEGVGVHVYHRRILGAMPLGDKYQEKMEQLFATWPCNCGHHPAERPPLTGAEKQAHNQASLEAEAAGLCLLPPGRGSSEIEAWVEAAVRARRLVGLGRVRPTWRAVGKRLGEMGDTGQTQAGS